MIKRSVEEWQNLFAEQASSGLSQAAFCRDKGLCPRHFSLRKKQLGSKPVKSASGFVPVQVKLKRDVGLQLHWQDCRLSLPCDVSPIWVADLLKSLV